MSGTPGYCPEDLGNESHGQIARDMLVKACSDSSFDTFMPMLALYGL